MPERDDYPIDPATGKPYPRRFQPVYTPRPPRPKGWMEKLLDRTPDKVIGVVGTIIVILIVLGTNILFADPRGY